MTRFDAIVRWARGLNPLLVDCLLVAFLLAIDLVAMMTNPETPGPGTQGPSVVGALLLGLENIPLVWRRQRPVMVLILVIVAFMAYQGAGFPAAPQFGLLLALFAVGAHAPQRRARLAAGIAIPLLTVFVIFGVIFTEGVDAMDVIPGLVVLITVFMAGEAVRTRRAHARTLEERAELLERERDEKARRAVEDERQRIARELHDVVAHHVSVMVVQAGAGRRIVEERPQEAKQVLGSIEATGRQALSEMRRLLGVLRQDGGDAEELAPQPGMEGLEVLIEQVREAGLAVDLVVEGRPRRLSRGVDLSAFRIVQEALTNTLKHAGPATAQVRVCYSNDALEIRVTDDGRGTSSGSNGRGGGQGLVGMRERIVLFGGELSVGPRPGGGYEVRAKLPLEDSE